MVAGNNRTTGDFLGGNEDHTYKNYRFILAHHMVVDRLNGKLYARSGAEIDI